MRGGVPPALWSRTVTLYEQAAPRDFVGDSGGLRTQVVLLDAAGVVALHDPRGFSETGAEALAAAVARPRRLTRRTGGVSRRRSRASARAPGS